MASLHIFAIISWFSSFPPPLHFGDICHSLTFHHLQEASQALLQLGTGEAVRAAKQYLERATALRQSLIKAARGTFVPKTPLQVLLV